MWWNGSNSHIWRKMVQPSMHKNTRVHRVQAASEINSCKCFHGYVTNKRSIAELSDMFGISFSLCNDVASISHFWDPIKEKHQTGNQGKNSHVITKNSTWGVLRVLCFVMHIIAFGSFLRESVVGSNIFEMGEGGVKNLSRGLRIFPLMVAYCGTNIWCQHCSPHITIHRM